MKKRVRIGDLVTMYTHDTGLIGLVLERHPNGVEVDGEPTAQIGIKWFNEGGSFEWEPEGWLEVVSEGR